MKPTYSQVPRAGAGQKDKTEIARTVRARKNVASTGRTTGQTLKDNVSRIQVPGIDPDALIQAAEMADAFDQAVSELEALLITFRQGNFLWSSEVHQALCTCITYVRAGTRADARLLTLFSALVEYFKNQKKA